MATKKDRDMNKKRRHVIIGNKGWGLYYGEVEASDAEIGEAGYVTLYNARHIAHWKGGTGGITSLASWGPRDGSRIGAPTESALIRDVATVFAVHADAVPRFDAVKAELPR